MNIHLTPESEKLVNEQLARGDFRSPEEVIEHALEVLHSEGEWIEDNKDSINNKIERAFRQFEEGPSSQRRNRAPIWTNARLPGCLHISSDGFLPAFR